MDWWPTMNGCATASIVGDINQLDAAIFDPWIHSEDLDLASILQTTSQAAVAASVSSSASTASTCQPCQTLSSSSLGTTLASVPVTSTATANSQVSPNSNATSSSAFSSYNSPKTSSPDAVGQQQLNSTSSCIQADCFSARSQPIGGRPPTSSNKQNAIFSMLTNSASISSKQHKYQVQPAKGDLSSQCSSNRSTAGSISSASSPVTESAPSQPQSQQPQQCQQHQTATNHQIINYLASSSSPSCSTSPPSVSSALNGGQIFNQTEPNCTLFATNHQQIQQQPSCCGPNQTFQTVRLLDSSTQQLHLNCTNQRAASNKSFESTTTKLGKQTNATGHKVKRCRHLTDFVLADEEKRLLIKEGYADFPMSCESRSLSKSEERILRKIRRKIRNKKSAQCSRQRKKEYVEDLEKKYASVVRENEQLRRALESYQQQQQQQQQRDTSTYHHSQQQQHPAMLHNQQSHHLTAIPPSQQQQQQHQIHLQAEPSGANLALDWKDIFVTSSSNNGKHSNQSASPTTTTTNNSTVAFSQ